MVNVNKVNKTTVELLVCVTLACEYNRLSSLLATKDVSRRWGSSTRGGCIVVPSNKDPATKAVKFQIHCNFIGQRSKEKKKKDRRKNFSPFG